LVILVSLLAFGSGCARPDWIEQTLVTADVTGTWRNEGGFLELTLEQQGSKVTGSMFQRISNIRAPVAGTVTGDVFKFEAIRTNTTYTGELTVSGDEMNGYVRSFGGRVNTSMRRVDASAPASQQ
jgi:hypothetical protein